MLTRRKAINFTYNFKSIFDSKIGLKFEEVLGSFPGFGKVTISASNISFGKEAEGAAERGDRRATNSL